MGGVTAWSFWVATIAVACGYGGLTQRMWAARHDVEIKARSPTLIFVSTLGGFVVMMLMLLQWRNRAQGNSLPCITMAYTTPFGEHATWSLAEVTTCELQLTLVYNSSLV